MIFSKIAGDISEIAGDLAISEQSVKKITRIANRLRGESEVGVRFWFLQYIYIIYCPLVVWKYTKFSIHARAWWPSARANTRIAVW